MAKKVETWKLLANCNVFAPEDLGICDILIKGGKVVHLGNHPMSLSVPGDIDQIDLTGKYVVPGFIDIHEHLIGGGGLNSPISRMPEIFISDLVSAGITTVIGVIGSDFLSKTLLALLMKARQLELEGLTAFILTGGIYSDPLPTLTGSVIHDIILVDKVVGAKISVSEPNAYVRYEDLVKVVYDVVLASSMVGKPKVVHVHGGRGSEVLRPLLKLQEEGHASEVKLQVTHCNRSELFMAQGINFARNGGFLDVTTSMSPTEGYHQAIKPSECVKRFIKEGVPINQITMSTDANGNHFEMAEDGTIKAVRVAFARQLYEEFLDLVLKEGFSLSDALRVVSTNGADIYRLKGKGRMQTGGDADLLVLDEKLNITDVFCKGSRMIEKGKVVTKSLFEKSS